MRRIREYNTLQRSEGKKRKGKERRGRKRKGTVILMGAQRYVEIRASCAEA
jgi:hypothetical protein